jgi:hypothetical protein
MIAMLEVIMKAPPVPTPGITTKTYVHVLTGQWSSPGIASCTSFRVGENVFLFGIFFDRKKECCVTANAEDTCHVR